MIFRNLNARTLRAACAQGDGQGESGWPRGVCGAARRGGAAHREALVDFCGGCSSGKLSCAAPPRSSTALLHRGAAGSCRGHTSTTVSSRMGRHGEQCRQGGARGQLLPASQERPTLLTRRMPWLPPPPCGTAPGIDCGPASTSGPSTSCWMHPRSRRGGPRRRPLIMMIHKVCRSVLVVPFYWCNSTDGTGDGRGRNKREKRARRRGSGEMSSVIEVKSV